MIRPVDQQGQNVTTADGLSRLQDRGESEPAEHGVFSPSEDPVIADESAMSHYIDGK